MYTPRLQYADQPVLRPKRIQNDAQPVQKKPVELKHNGSDLNSIFKRLLNSSNHD
ncbi:hypothetical protein [Undibacterium sp. TJN19]|uniref:hypothetical protein n=1 Tax=Undibacterium sp. TJN19 TaxID=3413055 RepID=UPI003BF1F45B